MPRGVSGDDVGLADQIIQVPFNFWPIFYRGTWSDCLATLNIVNYLKTFKFMEIISINLNILPENALYLFTFHIHYSLFFLTHITGKYF